MEINNYLVELGGVENGYFRRNHYMTLEEAYNEGGIDRYLDKLNNTDVYRTIYLYETDDIESTNLIAPLYFDLDIKLENESDFKKVVRDTLLTISFLEEELHIDRDSIEIYFSGSKGFHVIVPFESLGIEPCSDLPEKYKAIANRVKKETIYKTIDTSIYERKRLFRFPNSVNGKTGLYKTAMSFDYLRTANYEMICDYAAEPREVEFAKPRYKQETTKAINRILLIEKMREMKRRHPRTIIPAEEQDILPCVAQLLEEGIGQGGRNNTCVAIASSLAQSGMERDDAVDTVLSWNDLNSPPLPKSEVVRTVHSAYQMAENGKGYGCSFFKDNGHCIGDECKLFRGNH